MGLISQPVSVRSATPSPAITQAW